MSLNNRPTKNRNPEAVPQQEAGASLPTEETTPVEEVAQRAIDDRNLLLDRVEELGGYEALGVRPDASLAVLHDTVMEAEAERDEREADRRSRGEAGRRLGEMFVGSILRGFHDAGRGAEAGRRPRIRDEERETTLAEQRAELAQEIDQTDRVTSEEEPLSDYFREEAERLGLDPDTATRDDISDAFRAEEAERLGLDPDASREEIQDEYRRRNAERLGLDSEASEQEIRDVERAKEAERLGLNPDATEEELHDEYHKRRAEEVGLSSDATDDEIDEARRTQEASKYGLDQNASWEEIGEARVEQKNQAIRDILDIDPETATPEQLGAAILGIDPNTSRDDFQRIARERWLEFCTRNGIDSQNVTPEELRSVLGIDLRTATLREILQAMKTHGIIIA